MTEPTQAAKQRACDLANAMERIMGGDYFCTEADFIENQQLTALAQHIQDISDAVEAASELTDEEFPVTPFDPRLERFILPKPAPDVLVEAMEKAGFGGKLLPVAVERIREHLAQRGHEVAPIKPA